MKRPSFQFYPGDWRLNGKLRRCSHAARGAWIDILCILHDEDEYGIARYPLAELACAAGCPIELAQELVNKGVLKGADYGAPSYLYRPRHAGYVGDPICLVDPMGGPVWYSSRMVEDEWRRKRQGNHDHQFSADNQPSREKRKTTSRSASRTPSGSPAGSPSGSPTRPVGDGVGDEASSPSSSSPSGSSVAKATGAPTEPPDKPKPPPAPRPTRAPVPIPPAPTGVVTKEATPEDLRKQRIWRAAKSFFEGQGMPQKQSGTYLGKFASDYGFEVFATAVERMVVERPADAKSWFTAACQTIVGERRARGASNKQVALEAGNDAAVEQYLAEKGMTNAK